MRTLLITTCLFAQFTAPPQPFDDWQKTNCLADGSVSKPFILVFTNRYGYKRRTPFDTLAQAKAFAADTNNNVVFPRYYKITEVK